jgi:hypothetical protein
MLIRELRPHSWADLAVPKAMDFSLLLALLL